MYKVVPVFIFYGFTKNFVYNLVVTLKTVGFYLKDLYCLLQVFSNFTWSFFSSLTQSLFCNKDTVLPSSSNPRGSGLPGCICFHSFQHPQSIMKMPQSNIIHAQKCKFAAWHGIIPAVFEIQIHGAVNQQNINIPWVCRLNFVYKTCSFMEIWKPAPYTQALCSSRKTFVLFSDRIQTFLLHSKFW